MQDFEMDFTEEAASFELAENGLYELEISNAELKKTENGKNYIGLTIVVREDVNQNCCGVKMWDNIWENEVYRNPQTNKRMKKDDYNALPQAQKQNIIVKKEYNDFQIRTLVHAQDVDQKIKDANGNETLNPEFKTKFGNIEEVVLFLNGLCFQAKVSKITDDNTGKERNVIDYKSVKRTSVSRTQTKTVQQVEVTDEELPF